MNNREAFIEALRSVAGIAEGAPGGGYDPTGNDADNEKIFKHMERIVGQLYERAERLAEGSNRRGPREPALPEQPTAALRTEMHHICSASSRGKPCDVRRLMQLRDRYTVEFDAIAREEKDLAQRELMQWGAMSGPRMTVKE